jgi:hypothetical protein
MANPPRVVRIGINFSTYGFADNKVDAGRRQKEFGGEIIS